MNPFPQVIVFGDSSWPAESILKALPTDTPVVMWLDGQGWVNPPLNIKTKLKTQPCPLLAVKDIPWDLGSEMAPIAIIGFQDTQKSSKVSESLKSECSQIKILELGHRGSRIFRGHRRLSWKEMFSESVDREIYLLSLQDQVRQLRNVLKDAERVAMLLQDDPDPDGIASALALRKILGRKAQTAPLVSFGKITRPENMAMIRLLDVEIQQITEQDLANFGKVVLIDCQPSFFKGRKVPAHVILDHHPKGDWQIKEGDPDVEFCVIREDLGAVSTLLSLYMRAVDEDFSQRLATALLYGIKADTLMLNREVSELDLDAFLYLYPQINSNILRRIERPELPLEYIQALSKGLRYLTRKENVVILPLPSVQREEWIPQAADFALQVEGAKWAFSCGVCEGHVVISGRNCGYVQHCGDLFKKIFGDIGRAGGHRTMAKAMIPKAKWIEHFGENSLTLSKMTQKILRLVLKEADENSSECLAIQET